MTQRVQGARFRLIRRGERITAGYLNDLAAAAERNAKPVEDIVTEVPEGEDGEGALDAKEYAADFSAPTTVTTTVRIEDDTDPTVAIEIERIDRIVFINVKDPDDLLDLTITWPAPP